MAGWSSDLQIVLSFVTASAIVFVSIPTIVTVSHAKGLFDKPGLRKSHTRNIPNLGGIAIFAGLIVSLGLFVNHSLSREVLLLMSSMTILFFIGLKDDILVIAPDKKLIGELFAILILVVMGDIRFTTLHGFLGITHLNYIVSILLTTFVMVVIINAFNLIDGIDGLASGIGIIIALTFAGWFYLTGYYNYSILAVAIAGSYIGFFGFNVFGDKNKIFMGDTGSLILGLVISVLVIKFNEINAVYNGVYKIHAAPAVSFGFLIIPMFDTIRVFIIRIAKGKSPFHPDKNHLHHRLLLLGFSHIETTLIISTVNIFFIFLALVMQTSGVINLMIINLSVATGMMLIAEFFIRQTSQKLQNVPASPVEQYSQAPAKSA